MRVLTLLLISLLLDVPGRPSHSSMLETESSTAASARGIVVLRKSGCDYFLVETTMGFDFLEWYGGNDPSRGDELVGSFEEYGFQDIYNISASQELRVWVEEYWLGRSGAIEMLYDKCG